MPLRFRTRSPGILSGKPFLKAALMPIGIIFLFPASPFGAEGPLQPIAFSHRLHAGDNNIPCLYCHAYAERSPLAGIPSVSRCLSCHQVIASEKPEIQKLQSYLDRQEPIPWVRVNRLPGYVRFSHKRHVKKEIDCQECHGPVQTMDRVRKVGSFGMGWCVSCHDRHGADRDCMVCHY